LRDDHTGRTNCRMLRVGIARDGQPTPGELLRSVTLSDSDKNRDVQLYLLGARKNEQGALELVLFAKGDSHCWPFYWRAIPQARNRCRWKSRPARPAKTRRRSSSIFSVVRRAELSLIKSE